MKIYYSPYYKGHVFRGLSEEKSILIDEMTADTSALIGQLQLMLGLHPERVSDTERLTQYYRTLKAWLEAHKENELYVPFQTAGLDVARCCLEWRDELRLGGWSEATTANNDRLKALQGVETEFKSNGMAEHIEEVLEALSESADDSCADITLAMPCDVDLLHPIMQRRGGGYGGTWREDREERE